MNDVHPRPRPRRIFWLLGLAGLVLGAAAGGAVLLPAVGKWRPAPPPPPPTAESPPTSPVVAGAEVHKFCGACHAYPPPDTFPRAAWKDEVERGYKFFADSGLPLRPPAIDGVVRHFEERAPDVLPPAGFERAASPPPVRFDRVQFPPLPGTAPPAISNINLVHLSDPRRLDVLACDMRRGQVLLLKPYEPAPAWRVLGKVPNPCHTEVVDLDGDGIPDILIADLGNFQPTDRRCGSVVWLRGNRDGSYTPFTLLKDVGRVADVEAADFRGTGKKDLVVAVFGWQTTGNVLFLENRTTDWARPQFVPQVLDERHGGIHVPVADLNGDGKPDFVALISQEHETVVAFLNEGGGKFRKETLYTAPHPAWGSSGIQLVDMDGDGKLDVLYTNGDVLDKPYLLKPYHSIQWLENRTSDWAHPRFVHHPLTPMYGVHRAVVADFTGTGKKDIAAVAFLPEEGFPRRREQGLDSVILLEQTTPGRYARHTLESGTCDHVTCAVGDVFGSGRVDLVTGYFGPAQTDAVLTVWKNLGPRAAATK